MVSSVFKRVNLLVILTLWRLILFTPLLVGAYILSYNLSSPISYIYHYINNPNLSFNVVFLYPWANFDGMHYLNIAQHGYTNQARFFPLFPLILKVASGSLGASIILVTVIFFLAIYFFKKLIALDFPNNIAIQSLIYLLLFPTSFFFVSIYSESFFLLLSILAFYFARKRRWFLSIICAMLLMTTRFVGIAILPALLYEFATNEKIKLKKLALFLIAPLGLIAYSLFNYYKWHNFLYFIQAQGELGNNRTVTEIVLFPQTIFRYIKILFTASINYEWMIALLELVSFIFAAFLLYFTWKKKIRVSYLIFAVINFAIIVSTGTFSGLPRYVLTMFPIFIALALIKNKLFKFVHIIISPILLFIVLMLFSRGYFVA
ncbi:hypothetical protein HYS96_04625 [Candidatus Daviesbacteria bacterium]|nr:hypothetical protein [Candidatus Daviesbacteria bacterium]